MHYAKGQYPEYYTAQVHYADLMVGKIVDKVDELGIMDNTIIIYTSDNGTVSSSKMKGVEYGVHIPFVVAGGGTVARGMTDELIDFTDVLPTLAEFAEASIPIDKPVDGVSFAQFLAGRSETTKPVIYAQPGLCTLARTKEYMLEAVSPLTGHPDGRFYKTNGSYDGRGYENITHDDDYTKMRNEFEIYIDNFRSRLPTSFDDSRWFESPLTRGYEYWSDEAKMVEHVALPTDYQFYDPSF